VLWRLRLSVLKRQPMKKTFGRWKIPETAESLNWPVEEGTEAGTEELIGVAEEV
jgi:hypothetical protein